MKKLLSALALAVALAVPATTAAVTLHKTFLDGTIYLYDKPCDSGSSLKEGKAQFKDGRSVRLCWVIENGVMWFVDDNMGIGSDAADDYKPLSEPKKP